LVNRSKEWIFEDSFELIEDETKNNLFETVRSFKGIYLDKFFVDKMNANFRALSIFGKDGLLEANESILIPSIFVDNSAKFQIEIEVHFQELFESYENFTFLENTSNLNAEKTKNYVIVIRKSSNIKIDSNSNSNMKYSLDLPLNKSLTISSFIKTIENYYKFQDHNNPKNFQTFNCRRIFDNIIHLEFGISDYLFPFVSILGNV